MYLGDFLRGRTVHFDWNTFGSSGQSITRATNGTISVYKDGGVTQTTTGVTDTEDFDSLTGVHHCAIATTDAFYTPGSEYSVVLSAATIDGQVVNATIAAFSIENRFAAALIRRGTAQGGAAQSITLDASASATNDFYGGAATSGCFIFIESGTGALQGRFCTAYNGTSKVATVDRAWIVQPDSTSVFLIYASSAGTSVDEIGDDIALRTLLADVVSISGDGPAADNAESFFDGTGYAGTNNVIPLVTDITTKTGFRLSATGVDDILDEVVEGSTTLRQSIRLANAANGAKTSGMATASAVIRDLADSKNRVAATVDADGNRTAVTLDLS